MSMMGHNNPPSSGFILVARAMAKHKLVGIMMPVKPKDKNAPAATRFEAWFDLLIMACYEEKTTVINGKKYELEAGDNVCAASFLSNRWNWTPKTVRGFLDRLQQAGMLVKKNENAERSKGMQPNHLSVCNYSTYQNGDAFGVLPKGKTGGKTKGKTENELTRCNKTKNMFEDEPEGQDTGQDTGPQEEKQTKTNKTIINNSKKSKPDFQIALDEYNQLADRVNLSKAKVLNKARKKSLDARLSEHGLDGWREAMANIEKSLFLCGEVKGDREFKAGFDFVLQPSSFLKILEGGFDSGRKPKSKISPQRKKELLEKFSAPDPIIREDAR